MKAKEFIPVSKPRNFVAKNQQTAGAGAHKDKKRAEKQGDVKHKKQAVPMESSLNELAGYGSDKKYKSLGSYKRYDVYVGKQKFKNLYYIAVAENPRTLDAKFKAKGNSAEEAFNKLKDEIDKEIDVATKVSGQATLDFNVDFVKDILEMSSSVFYAKIVAGPKLIIAGPEMMEYPEIMRDEGFKASAIRTHKGGEGTTKLPGVPLSAKAASSANLIANGRYVLGSETVDKDGNRVFNLEFDSVVQASNDKMRLRAPAVTVGTNRSQGVGEEAAGVGIVTKQNATVDVPVGGEYMNVKKLFPKKKKPSMAEATGDRPFDNMMKTIKKGTAKQATADRREQRKQSQQQARDAFGTMFGGGNPADKLGIRKPGVAEGLLGEFAMGGDDGEDPTDNYPCYDCGSTIFLHHTELCELAEDNAIRDLPAKPGSQYWTGQIPKGLRPIPGLEQGVAEATSLAVRMQRAADRQRAKSDASLARTPSSIPKKEEPKK